MTTWHVYDMREAGDGTQRFDVRLSTALGPVYMRGFRLKGDTVLPPCFRAGQYFVPVIRLPKNAKAAIKTKALSLRSRQFGRDSFGTTSSSHTELGSQTLLDEVTNAV